VLSTTGEIDVDADGNPTRIYGICLDITEQRRAEEAARRSEAAADEERRRSQEMLMRLHDADLRRQHALEINDNVVQGLAAVIYAFESGLEDEALAGLRRTIRSARMMMNGLLSGGDTAEMRAGDLLRGAPVTPMLRRTAAPAVNEVDSPLRVLLVDDAADIRMVLRTLLDRKFGCKVVGEAEDGAAGVDMAKELQPDVVVLDLAMPVMDGLQALPMIRVAAPNAKVIVLSGFDKSRMEVTALGAGADAYVEKGHASRQLMNAIAGLLPGRLDTFAI
jgi:CheY-like chemotaxis protein